jgi:hypothetical protein
MTWRILPTLAVALLCAAAGCEAPGGGDVCVYGGKTYREGDTFPASDGCNMCSCGEDGNVSCTEIACAPDTCVYDGRVYPVGGTFPSTDGCNTCSCGEGGQVACTKRACAPLQWLSLFPKQCNGNPWQMVTSKGDGEAPPYPNPELLAIDNFFEDQGIELPELGLLSPDGMSGTCGSCDCARGDRLIVRATAADAAKLTAQFGFAAVTAAEALHLAARQCSNPWPPAGAPAGEVKSIQTWADGLGAPLRFAGSVYPTVAVGTCEACTCARGDRIVVYPKEPGGTTKLKAQGFEALSAQ